MLVPGGELVPRAASPKGAKGEFVPEGDIAFANQQSAIRNHQWYFSFLLSFSKNENLFLAKLLVLGMDTRKVRQGLFQSAITHPRSQILPFVLSPDSR